MKMATIFNAADADLLDFVLAGIANREIANIRQAADLLFNAPVRYEMPSGAVIDQNGVAAYENGDAWPTDFGAVVARIRQDRQETALNGLDRAASAIAIREIRDARAA